MPNVLMTALGERAPCRRGWLLLLLAVRHFGPVTFSADTGKKVSKTRGEERAEDDKGFNSLRIEVSAERQKMVAGNRGKV